MENSDYQWVALGLISAVGMGYSLYYHRIRKRVVDTFCKQTVPDLVNRMEEIIKNLDGLEGGLK